MTKTVKIEGSIWASLSQYSKEFNFIFCTTDITNKSMSQEFIPIAPYVIEIEMLEDIDLIAVKIQFLQNKRKLVLANNELALNTIDGQIQELLAIENKS